MNDCIFCRIIEGEIPSHKVYEDDKTLAFLDANPTSKGHTLVVPKKHVETIDEASDMSYMWDSLVKVSQAVEEAFDPEGLNISQNNGAVAGQEVMHMHFHVTPRYSGDEIEVNYNRKELENGEELAEEINSSIREP